ncbi:MAG: hypothetical protein JNM08_02420 [Rubrivivax sp.]|nr:hypothetical protein [Rubrivivax sp.]
MISVLGDSSVLLWLAAALIAFLGARSFVEYFRRTHHEGPLRMWREWLMGTGCLVSGLWASMVIDISAKGVAFELGYHPLKIFGTWVIGFLMMGAVVAGVTFRPRWYWQLTGAALATLVTLFIQVAVVWSIGAEPGLHWRSEPLSFALLIEFTGLVVAGRMVAGPRRGSPGDRKSRRLMAALVLGACIVAAQELVLAGSGLDRQVVSAHARFLPEVAITLVAGAVVPISMLLMFVDQRTQQRARASERARRRRHRQSSGAGGGESMFSDSLLVDKHPGQH